MRKIRNRKGAKSPYDRGQEGKKKKDNRFRRILQPAESAGGVEKPGTVRKN